LQGFIQHQVAYLIDIGISESMAATAYSMFVLISVAGRLGLGFMGLKYPMHILTIISMIVLILGMMLIFWSKTLPMIIIYNAIVGIGMGASVVAIMNLVPLYFGKTHYPKIMGYVLPFSTILGGLGNPLAGRIRDITGSYVLAWKVSIVVLTVSLVFLILARPPVHPSVKKPAQS
jgi:MFS family permease